MIHISRVLLLATTVTLLSTSLSLAQEWTRFRGPNGSGLSSAKTVPTRWSDSDYNWTFALPGRGHSSPVIWGDRIWVSAAELENGKIHLLCVDRRDGKELWRKSPSLSKHRKHKNNSFASNTATVDADAVYFLQQTPRASPLTAFDHLGKELWSHDLGPYRHGQGAGTSPIIFEDLLIVSNDHGKGSSLIALDRKTGKTRWEMPREGKRACYSTPCVFKRGTESQLVFTHSFEGIIGVSPKTGKQIWHVDPFGRFPQRAVASPVVAGDLIFGSSGARTGKRNLVAIRVGADQETYTASEAYRITRTVPHVPTPIVYEGKLFLWADVGGILSCFDAVTAKLIWRGRTGGNYFSSPICVDGKLYGVEADGTVVVTGTGDKFEILARNELGEPSKATPAVSHGTLYLRSESKLYSIGGK